MVGNEMSTPLGQIRPLIGNLLLVSTIALFPSISEAQLPNASLSPGNLPTSTEDGYILGVGDRVRVDIFNVPEYSGEYRVLVDGTINLPLAGSIPVRGMTIQQATQTISQRYTASLRRPIITLSLQETRPINIAIAGEINRPGSYSVSSADSLPTITRALQLAGGITQAADLGNVQLRRVRPGGGASQVVMVNLWQLLREGNLEQDIVLRDGDTLIIPTASEINLADARQLTSASFAANESRPVQVAVVGEVNRPGPYTLTPEGSEAELQVPTVTKAIQVAGGITQTADIRNIEIRRPTQNGVDQMIKVDFWELLQAGDLRQDLPLQPGDTVVIPTARALSSSEATELAATSFSPTQMTVNVVGEVASPGSVQVPPNTPLNQALLAAGGFNNRARRGTVQLIRLNPDGTVSQREISVDFAQGISAENNPALRPNDTLVVGRSGLASVSDTLGSLLSPITGVFSIFRLLGL